MTEDDYAPFPERELTQLAELFEYTAAHTKGYFHGISLDRAKVCRDALAGHAALRERFLEQTTEMRAALGKANAA